MVLESVKEKKKTIVICLPLKRDPRIIKFKSEIQIS